MQRTIKNLSKLNGKVYVYLEDEKISKIFLKNAESEGFRFGKILPTENECSNIIAVEKNNQLSYVGFVGHMAFQCPSGVEGDFYRIDYRKYINGDRDFYFENSPFNPPVIKGKYYSEVTIVGNRADEAAKYLKAECLNCKNANEEFELHGKTENLFDVCIFTEEE